MLTVEKLRVYESFNGDIDGWARHKDTGNSASISDSDWYLIDELKQGFALVATGATKEFIEALENRLNAVSDDEVARQMVKRLAGLRQ